MAIEEMILLNMTFDRRDLDQVLFTLKDSKYFYPQPASKIVNNVKGVHALFEDSAYTKLLDRLIQVASDMKLDLNKDLAPDKTLNFDKTNQYLIFNILLSVAKFIKLYKIIILSKLFSLI